MPPRPFPVPNRPPSAVFARGHAASVATPSERKRSSVALDLVRCAPDGAPAGYIRAGGDALDLHFPRPHPPPTQPSESHVGPGPPRLSER
jgi:hypothetical protein